MPRISVTHLARNLADIVNRVAYQGERFTVVRGNREVAELVPAPRGRPLSGLPTLLRGLPKLSPEEMSAFASDVDAARRAIGPPPASDPWES